MDERPDWVPDWGWDEYLRFVRKWSGWVNHHGNFADTGQLILEVGKKVVFERECAKLWRAIGRRSPDACKNSNIVHGVLMRIVFALKGPAADEIVPARERKERGTRIARMALDLQQEMMNLSSSGVIPRSFAEAFFNGAEIVSTQVRGSYDEFENVFGKIPLSAEALDEIQFSARDGFLAGLKGNFPALTALAAGAKTWMNSEPAIYRPNDPGAKRLYFLRQMTSYFRSIYGTPLRDATASLANLFFDGNLDAATVAKLAP